MKTWSNIYYLQSFGHNYPFSLSRDSLYPFYIRVAMQLDSPTDRVISNHLLHASISKNNVQYILGFISFNTQLFDYNFISVTCEKSAFSLTLPNTSTSISSSSNTEATKMAMPFLASLELIELSSINIVSLVLVSSCGNTGSIRDDLY